jgi:hypothetical protein
VAGILVVVARVVVARVAVARVAGILVVARILGEVRIVVAVRILAVG